MAISNGKIVSHAVMSVPNPYGITIVLGELVQPTNHVCGVDVTTMAV